MDEGSIPIDATKITGRFKDEESDNHVFSSGLTNRQPQVDLRATTPLDRAIDSDEDLY